MKSQTILLAFALLLGFSACTEDPTTTEMLTDGRWQMSTLTINPGVIVSGVVITDYYSQLYEYDKDNILEFIANGTFITDEGPTKEFPSDPQTKQGNWLLSANEDMLTVWMAEDTLVYDLLNISGTAMTMTYSQRDTSTNINYTLTAGFGKY
ncbi:MAG: hypothetical protein K9J06_03285 [Flavobacteriales bacterium]|nr:hypothetical protein [Flavobacteriales bacterium]